MYTLLRVSRNIAAILRSVPVAMTPCVRLLFEAVPRLGLAFGIVLALAGCASPAASRSSSPTDIVTRRMGIMGTTLEVVVEAAGRESALRASERAVGALEAAEARLSTWRDDSELARLNAAPAAAPFPLSRELARELTAVRRCWEETDGAFDPSVGGLVKAWGLRTGGRRPAPEELAAALAAVGLGVLRVEQGSAVRGREGLLLEEGGFGKGAGLAAALEALVADEAVQSAYLDLGGQVSVFSRGSRRGEEWTVALADPRQRNRPVVSLTIDRGSVSTSGNSERGIVVDGEALGHILDPRTGRPAPDFGSLTVWTDDPLRADCLSTGLSVMGPEAALDWAARHPGVEVLVLRPRGGGLEALASPGLRQRMTILADEVTVRDGD